MYTFTQIQSVWPNARLTADYKVLAFSSLKVAEKGHQVLFRSQPRNSCDLRSQLQIWISEMRTLKILEDSDFQGPQLDKNLKTHKVTDLHSEHQKGSFIPSKALAFNFFGGHHHPAWAWNPLNYKRNNFLYWRKGPKPWIGVGRASLHCACPGLGQDPGSLGDVARPTLSVCW